jgi:thioredoxin-dependent peroxiredoxin
MRNLFATWILMGAVLVTLLAARLRAERTGDLHPPKIGNTIKDYEFRTIAGKELKLARVIEKGPVVLVVLRGFPGYQCPVCTKQVADLRKHAHDFKELGASVVLVYPGAEDKLTDHAKQFIKDAKLPAPLVLVTDPNYNFISQNNLRWNMAGETAYPSTFVLDTDRNVRFAKVSKSHGDRAKVDEVLAVLRALRAADSKGQEIPQDRGTE